MDDNPIPAPSRTSRWRSVIRALPFLAVVLLIAGLGQSYYAERAARHALLLANQQGERVAALQDALGSLQQERGSLSQRLDDAAAVNRALREELLGLRERTRTLEDALAALSESRNGGTQALRLDEAEFLLRMAAERYRLFHDAAGALDATHLAAQALAGVDAPVYAPLRGDVTAAATALQELHPADRQQQLDTLAVLREQVWQLPLADAAPTAATQTGVLARIGHALAGLVRIRRTAQAPLAGAGADLVHELLALDLAQAQSALLAWDGTAYAAALAAAHGLFDARFAAAAPAAQQFAAQLATLRPLPAAPLPQLDAALTELRRLRALDALQSAAAPASASRGAHR